MNLGAPRIYTTNFDDLIERTFRVLGIPFERIATPRDVARGTGQTTEIIKYHGDLSNDPSLVLTESSYYSRLSFESPMDLKFRADLLGRSVLFIGYSFSDINIRIIWFRLLDMMRDEVSQDDLPTSYMVIMKPNPVEELLYRDAGIETIVLDPDGESGEERYPELFGDFMYELMTRVCDKAIPGSERSPFVSRTLLRRIREEGDGDALPRFVVRSGRAGGRLIASSFGGSPREMQQLAQFELPPESVDEAISLFDDATGPDTGALDAAIKLHGLRPSSISLARYLVGAVIATGVITNPLVIDGMDWEVILGLDIGHDARERVLDKAEAELRYHEAGEFDDELFYAIYLAISIRDGKLGASADDLTRADGILNSAEQLYPGILKGLTDGGREGIAVVVESHIPPEEEDEETPEG